MWVADNWKILRSDRLLNGEKLERWGDYTLVRPDPAGDLGHAQVRLRLEALQRTLSPEQKGGGEWEFFDLPQQWQIHYGELTFN